MHPRLRVALATSAAMPRLDPDDRHLQEALRALGIQAEAAVWDDPAVPWDEFRAVILRSTWDYHHRLPEFLAWTASLPTRLWNPPELVRWNADKRYLADLGAAGLPIVPTRFLETPDPAGLQAALDEWPEAVLKPTVSLGAHRTCRVRRGEAPEGPVTGQGPLMVQPFLPEIARSGEVSLVFFEGVFSHAVVKTPAPGDFRVQEIHGGRTRPFQAPREALDLARCTLQHCAPEALYGRVDLMRTGDGAWLLNEVELIEPSLFLAHGPGAAPALARCVAARVG